MADPLALAGASVLGTSFPMILNCFMIIAFLSR